MKQIMVGSTQVHIRNTIFRDIIIPSPSLLEQEKIASFLSVIDNKLEALKDKKQKLEAYKRGAMEQIFSQEICFIRPDGSQYPDWEEKKLEEVADIYDGTHQTPTYV